MTFDGDWIVVAMMSLNAGAAVGCCVGYYKEWRRRVTAEYSLDVARYEASLAATELVALRKTNQSWQDHAALMGQRNKFLAVELRGSDGTALTGVWPGRKHTIWHR
jgi:predicted nucleic acid-binding protein